MDEYTRSRGQGSEHEDEHISEKEWPERQLQASSYNYDFSHGDSAKSYDEKCIKALPVASIPASSRVLSRASKCNYEDEKKKRRVMANRKSAKASRERQKACLLQQKKTLETIEKDNLALKQENRELRTQKEELERQIIMRSNIQGHLSLPPQITNSTALSDDFTLASRSMDQSMSLLKGQQEQQLQQLQLQIQLQHEQQLRQQIDRIN
mmetsp:Transcript_6550/g.9626  ORF Transcript_6550/g.9626 Transcript_6550/m.9626 type:complete len:209 (-) Transcript_6550:187-813(-)|eukprot:CAMPEP_0194254070 /NCGR_PEP_ID=MMETSP0158-20130606/31300_1 /TAXON_ID=33649 /ORGANISM="Thalassionema nitzschioides, Strain L26-B" /LENGTH=208 /DNA_ID=CAMNT_0038991977 /DNA_START=138 /DNA_END=764 /DNA_ORIENTATION=+